MRQRKLMNQINVVPYIDVMLVLLVIFMVTAPLVNPGVVDLPSVGKAAQPPVAPMEVVIRGDGSLLLRDRDKGGDERRVTNAELVAVLQKRQATNPDQPVVIAADKAHGTLLFSIFNGVARQKAEVLDGLTLACLRDAGGSPVSSTCVLERVCDLTGDSEEDDRRYEAFIAAQGSPLAAEGTVPEPLRAHLTREVDPASLGIGGLLRMYFGQSMARGSSLSAASD